MTKKHPPLLGAHMSVAGGLEKAFYAAASIGCTALQIFTHSNRQWAMKPLTQESIDAFAQAQKSTGIQAVVVHASYLINLGSDSADTVKKSRETLKKELDHCRQLRIPYLVLHPGAGKKGESEKAMKLISQGLTEVLASDEHEKNRPNILLETMAGQGGQVGYTFEELAFLKSNVHQKKRIGFCIDTCHLWAAGYDISTEKGYTKVMDEFDSILGLSHLKAMHMNDSKQKLGSHVDRHAEIGKGTMGLDAFRFLMNDSRLDNVAKILETPDKALEAYAHNMKVLTSLISR